MAMIRGTKANTQSVVPTGGAPKGGSPGKNKKLRGTNPQAQSVVPATAPVRSNTRGGPAKGAPKGKGVVASGGGSFGQS